MKFTPVYDLDQGKVLGYLRDLTPQGTLVIGKKNSGNRLSLSFPAYYSRMYRNIYR